MFMYDEHCICLYQGNYNFSIVCCARIEYVPHVAQRRKQTGSEGEHRGHLTVNKWRCINRITAKTSCISRHN